ncbi:ABC transporter permease [Methanoregula sp.]|uniref:ABC transporter permease n=1 Tax=Methanoregula sp. TaxID=2052170 RepID=UPI0026373F9C|nr:ABC transporter permease [Methanoregula sp.]MDD5143514.1 ABC transporter permease [Methanoregula sp.]
MGKYSTNGRDWRLGALAIVCTLIIWQFIATVIIRYPFILPAPTDVFSAFISLIQKGDIFIDLGTSLVHFAIGLGLALIVGIPLGIIIGWNRRIEALADPVIELLRPIPPLAWIPFAIIWFGLTSFSAGFIIFIGAVFPIIINTYSGFRGVPRVFVEAGKMLGCTKDRDLVRYIAFPAALPSVAAGIRIATGVGWMCLVAAELFGVSNFGLGQKLWFYYSLHQMDSVVVYMILLGLIGLAFDMIFRYYVDKKFLKWRTGEVA